MKREAKRTTEQQPARNRRNSRKAVDRQISLRLSMIFLAFMLLIALFLLVVPRSTFSQVERRNLATWPEFSFENYFSGEYTAGIMQVYDDTVPARDSFKNAGNNLKSMFGIHPSTGAEIIGASVRIQDQNRETQNETTPAAPSEDPDAAAAPAETAAAEKEPETQEEINSKDYHQENGEAFMQDGIVVVFQDGHWRAITLYGGLYDTQYADTVNYIHQVLGDDVHLYVMPAPSSSQFYLPSDYADYSVDQSEVFEQFSQTLDEGITAVDAIEALNNHNTENIYLRTDHHWAPLGAYYAAREFARAADVPFADLSTYTEHVNPGYVGTMYAYTESANILNDPEDFVYYVPANNYTVDYYDSGFNYMYTADLFFDMSDYVSNSYSTFLGSDTIIAKITTDNKNGRILLVIKDSFGNAEIPFYTGSFEQVYVIDQRFFDLNLLSFINYTGVTDVLFAHSYYSLTGGEATLLENIVMGNTEVPFYDGAPAADIPAAAPADTADEAADTQDAEAADTQDADTQLTDTDTVY